MSLFCKLGLIFTNFPKNNPRGLRNHLIFRRKMNGTKKPHRIPMGLFTQEVFTNPRRRSSGLMSGSAPRKRL